MGRCYSDRESRRIMELSSQFKLIVFASYRIGSLRIDRLLLYDAREKVSHEGCRIVRNVVISP